MLAKGKLFDALTHRAEVSPDFSELRFFDDILLLVYDSLQAYGQRHDLLQGAKYVGRAMTVTNTWIMKTAHDLPVVFRQEKAELQHASIRGEAYLVSPQHILAIDEYMMNNSWMNRQFVKSVLIDQKDNPYMKEAGHAYLNYPWSNALMYVGDKGMFADVQLKIRPIRSYSQLDQLQSKPFFDWDPYEVDWMRSEGHYPSYDPDDISDDMFSWGGRSVHMH